MPTASQGTVHPSSRAAGTTRDFDQWLSRAEAEAIEFHASVGNVGRYGSPFGLEASPSTKASTLAAFDLCPAAKQ